MIGIYKLYWPNSEYYYIGQSIHINNRFRGHIHLLKKKKHISRKLQDVYLQLGEPKLMVLEVCKKSELNIKELFYLANQIQGQYCCNISLMQPRRSCTLDFSLEEYQYLTVRAHDMGFSTLNDLIMHLCKTV